MGENKYRFIELAGVLVNIEYIISVEPIEFLPYLNEDKKEPVWYFQIKVKERNFGISLKYSSQEEATRMRQQLFNIISNFGYYNHQKM